MTSTIFYVIMNFKARIGDQSRALQIAANKLMTKIEINDYTNICDLQLMRDQFYVNDMTLTCCKLFTVKRNIFTNVFSLVIYYLFITLQMNKISNKKNFESIRA